MSFVYFIWWAGRVHSVYIALVDSWHRLLHIYPFDGIKVLVTSRTSGVTISIREKNNKPVSLFISPRGEFVAVTSGTTLQFFRKDDDYKKPCGSFTGYLPLLYKCICVFLQIWHVDYSSFCEPYYGLPTFVLCISQHIRIIYLLEYGPKIMTFLVLWMIARPYFSQKRNLNVCRTDGRWRWFANIMLVSFLLSLYVKLLTKHCLKTKATVNQALPEQVADGSSRLTNTLMALKSCQIAAASISPSLETSLLLLLQLHKLKHFWRF